MSAEVSVAEYCGLVSVCLAPRNVDSPLHQHWCAAASKRFRKLLEETWSDVALTSKGRGSNGEQFFSLVSDPKSCVTSKEGRLW